MRAYPAWKQVSISERSDRCDRGVCYIETTMTYRPSSRCMRCCSEHLFAKPVCGVSSEPTISGIREQRAARTGSSLDAIKRSGMIAGVLLESRVDPDHPVSKRHDVSHSSHDCEVRIKSPADLSLRHALQRRTRSQNSAAAGLCKEQFCSRRTMLA